jgi:hypothetical protein
MTVAFIQETVIPTLKKNLEDLNPVSSMIKMVRTTLLGENDPLIEKLYNAIESASKKWEHQEKIQLGGALDTIEENLEKYSLNVVTKKKVTAAIHAFHYALNEEEIPTELLKNLRATVDRYLVQKGCITSPIMRTLATSVLSESSSEKTTALSLLEPFLKGGIGGGFYALSARGALRVIEEVMNHIEGEEGAGMGAFEQAKDLLENQIKADNQSSTAYKEIFNQVWELCTKNPILLGGIELPIGINGSESELDPIEQLQGIAKEFK